VTDKVSVRFRGSQKSIRGPHACERRGSKRLLCSDLVRVYWNDAAGTSFHEIAILENLSLAGVGLFTGVPVPQDVDVHIKGEGTELVGRVKQCVFRENGYIVGMELDAASKWAQNPGQEFVPQHLLDVSLLDLD
jgi:hypothetical protein